MPECSHQNIIIAENACTFVKDNCGGLTSYFDFIHFYYCDLDQSIPLIVLVSLIFGFLIFNFLGAIADSYLAPSLEVVSKKLKLSETVSGITLLAFAASAPDVVTGIVAGGRAQTGVQVAVGGLFGACLFTITVVLAGCILGAKEIHADKNDLLRDIGFLLLTVAYFMFIAAFKEITPLMASGFFMIYIVFFIFVIAQEKYRKNNMEATL